MLGGSATINLPFLNWQTMKWKDKTVQAEMDSAKLNFEKALTTALNEVNTNYLAYKKRTGQPCQSRTTLSVGQEKTAITIKYATNTVKTS